MHHVVLQRSNSTHRLPSLNTQFSLNRFLHRLFCLRCVCLNATFRNVLQNVTLKRIFLRYKMTLSNLNTKVLLSFLLKVNKCNFSRLIQRVERERLFRNLFVTYWNKKERELYRAPQMKWNSNSSENT